MKNSSVAPSSQHLVLGHTAVVVHLMSMKEYYSFHFHSFLMTCELELYLLISYLCSSRLPIRAFGPLFQEMVFCLLADLQQFFPHSPVLYL